MIAHNLATLFKPYIKLIVGLENLPKPPFILAANHRSPLDPAFLLAATGLPIRFLAAGHLFQRRWGLMRLYNELIIRRLGQAIPTGPGSIERSVNILRTGGIVGIFPEGDIHPALNQNRLHTGVAIIAQQAHVPIVPVHIEGSERVWAFSKTFAPWRFRTVRLTIGPVILPPDNVLDQNGASTFIAEVMGKITRRSAESAQDEIHRVQFEVSKAG
ncbi:MAG: lysophospholipid acyltransferase family protein [Patescibacteria group bacterium]